MLDLDSKATPPHPHLHCPKPIKETTAGDCEIDRPRSHYSSVEKSIYSSTDSESSAEESAAPRHTPPLPIPKRSPICKAAGTNENCSSISSSEDDFFDDNSSGSVYEPTSDEEEITMEDLKRLREPSIDSQSSSGEPPPAIPQRCPIVKPRSEEDSRGGTTANAPASQETTESNYQPLLPILLKNKDGALLANFLEKKDARIRHEQSVHATVQQDHEYAPLKITSPGSTNPEAQSGKKASFYQPLLFGRERLQAAYGERLQAVYETPTVEVGTTEGEHIYEPIPDEKPKSTQTSNSRNGGHDYLPELTQKIRGARRTHSHVVLRGKK